MNDLADGSADRIGGSCGGFPEQMFELAKTCSIGLRSGEYGGSHKGRAVRAAIKRAGAKLFFLPKYSPDLNPIEQVFAKLRTLLRKTRARTIDAMAEGIRQSLTNFRPDECKNYLVNAGYASA